MLTNGCLVHEISVFLSSCEPSLAHLERWVHLVSSMSSGSYTLYVLSSVEVSELSGDGFDGDIPKGNSNSIDSSVFR